MLKPLQPRSQYDQKDTKFSSHIPLRTQVSRSRSNQEIADQLGLTIKTVRNHVSNIFSKLQVADRAQAVIRAREAGLGYGKTED